MTAASTSPVFFPGDPTIRGLAQLPTVMTAEDVAQGVGGTTLYRSFAAPQSAFDAFTVPTDPGESSPTTPTIGQQPTGSFGAGDGSDTTTDDSGGCPSFLAHPIDATSCVLDRFLFGILALLLIGFGIWIFASDDPIGDVVKTAAAGGA